MFCVDKVASDKEITKTEKCDEWINNKINHESTKRNKLFREWTISSTDDNKEKYRNQRNEDTAMIKKAKRESNSKNIGNNPNPKTLNRNLKSHKRKDQIAEVTPDLKTLNEIFTTIGSNFADSAAPFKEAFVPTFEKTMVLNNTTQQVIQKF